MKRIGSILLILLLCIASCGAYPLSTGDPAVQTSLDYLRACQKDDGGFGEAGRESSPGTTSWTIMAAVAAGEDPRMWVKNGNSTIDYLRSMNDDILAKGGTVDIARTILTLVAVGEDPRAFSGTDYVAELKSRVKSDGQAGDHVYTTIWTIVALASAGEDAGRSAGWLMSRQNADGGFPWTPGAESDPDDTGAALEALAAAGIPHDAAAVQNALAYLKGMQQENGGFHYGGTSAANAASDAWVIQGIVATGDNPANWRAGETSVVDHLAGLQNPDGSFRYTAYVTDNPCGMTASAIPALLGRPYPILPSPTVHSPSATPTPGIMAAAPTTTPAGTYAPAATDAAGRAVTVTDDYGEIVTIRGLPQKIVSLAPSNTEILYALGLEDRIVGVTDYCNYPPEAAGKLKVGGYSTINIEKVLATEPDLIFAATGNTEDVVNRLRVLGMTVVTLNPQTVDDVLRDTELVGVATGQEERAAACVRELQARIQAVTDTTEALAERPSVAHVVWYDPIWVSGGATFQDEVITMAGGTNAFGSTEGWGIVGLEEFITTNPEYIFVSSGTGMSNGGYDIVYDYFMNEPRMQRLDAVRNGHVYVVDADIISRGSPRIVDALEEVAATLHPDLFDAGIPEETHAAQSPGFCTILPAFALLTVLLIRAGKKDRCGMRWNQILPIFFVVIVASGLAYPVLGQALSGEELWRAELGNRIAAAALAESGLYGAVTTEESIHLYDQKGTMLWSYPVSCSRCVAISSDGECIVAGGDHLLLFDRKGEVLWRSRPESRVQSVAIAADGRTIGAGIGTMLRVFSQDNGQTIANVSWSFDTGDPIESVSIDGDGSSIVVGDGQGNIYLFSREGRLLWNYRTGSNGIRVAISRDGSTVAAGSAQQVTYLLNRNGRLLWKSPLQERIADVSISGDGSTLVLAGSGITLFNRNGENVWTHPTEEEIRCVSAQSSETTQILTGALDGTVSLLEVQPEPLRAETLDMPLPEATLIGELSRTAAVSDQEHAAPQEGMALSPAAPVTAGVCFVAARAWWRRGKR
ncbi:MULTISPECIES: helical backbone metal receptor [unclassified Methanoculleus]|uniref:helical backbone metal receptor n=1 Tax=unclassified Methanoculleus TaxID=2619537 RepID=UPI0025E793FC|nr:MULTISPECIES: helical backbone metal receptor [unclassified Methanoculleus]MCK9318422.1 helical backbone metal receptor [Methanoculleus sp.]MDD2254245.1 helical backbone metal receptor [Methanoculleus sp.]MDD2787699.1 helical backbone metal receptor [Methanoculleus sp.]MDD3216072.1 helical backbone metal receptor [Methanoculleus sp.]MDD4314013.1 helical backbone metal receptor [Methanoculleus sp.]